MRIYPETGLRTESHHTLACKGLLTRGYQAVSHGRSSQSHGSGGVLLAVRSGYPGQWADISLCRRLTPLFSCLRSPVGACSPGFSNSPLLQAEEALNNFVEQQIRPSADNDTTLIVGGDLNSFSSQALDTWGRPPSLSCSTPSQTGIGRHVSGTSSHPAGLHVLRPLRSRQPVWMLCGGCLPLVMRSWYSTRPSSGSGIVELTMTL